MTGLSYTGVPIAVGFAVLKYRLYDIDVIINRALVYGSLTVSLVTLYSGVIVVLQRVFVVLTGQQFTLAVVTFTLLVGAPPDGHRMLEQSMNIRCGENPQT